MTTIAADPEFRALRRYSARIGAEDSARFVVAAANPSGPPPSRAASPKCAPGSTPPKRW